MLPRVGLSLGVPAYWLSARDLPFPRQLPPLAWNMPTSWVSMTGGQTAWSKHTSSPWHTAVMGKSWWYQLAGKYSKRPRSSGPDSVQHTVSSLFLLGPPSHLLLLGVLLCQTPAAAFCSKRIPPGPNTQMPDAILRVLVYFCRCLVTYTGGSVLRLCCSAFSGISEGAPEVYYVGACLEQSCC